MGVWIAGFKTRCGSLPDWWLRVWLLTCAWLWLCYPRSSQQNNSGDLSGVGGRNQYLLKTLGKYQEFSIKLKRAPVTLRIWALSFQWPCFFCSFPFPSAAISCCRGVLSSSCIALPPAVPLRLWETLGGAAKFSRSQLDQNANLKKEG